MAAPLSRRFPCVSLRQRERRARAPQRAAQRGRPAGALAAPSRLLRRSSPQFVASRPPARRTHASALRLSGAMADHAGRGAEEEEEEGDDEAVPQRRSAKQRPRRSAGDPGSCQVVDCGSGLEGAPPYNKRYRICNDHYRASCTVVDGVPSRFCQVRGLLALSPRGPTPPAPLGSRSGAHVAAAVGRPKRQRAAGPRAGGAVLGAPEGLRAARRHAQPGAARLWRDAPARAARRSRRDRGLAGAEGATWGPHARLSRWDFPQPRRATALASPL